MPELPEVEIFKRYLDATSLHQRIDDVDVRNTYILKETSARELARGLKGRRFESSRRHGKHLFVRADGKLWLKKSDDRGATWKKWSDDTEAKEVVALDAPQAGVFDFTRDANASLLLVYSDGTDILTLKSDDNGETWS